MEIIVTSGTGSGPTPLAAFDAALLATGVANYNLICLSSIIPPGSVIQRIAYTSPESDFGKRLYVVMARHTETQPGKSAWTGLGWVQNADAGNGLFVEQDGSSQGDVESSIRATLAAMTATRKQSFGPIQSEIAGIECQDRPVCAVVIAVFKSQGWES